ncbi:MAG: hypothetical protein QG650_260 [Patescibacteria group bacterium]|nr:hypothetical protein [Patescibacteria group bacterium]
MKNITEAPRFKTVMADGVEYLEIAGLLVCKTDLVVPSEHVDGEFVHTDPEHPEYGQYFSLDAGVIHARYQGLAVPTPDEWADILATINPEIGPKGGWQDDVSVRETLGLKLAGLRYYSPAGFYNQGTHGNYWASSPTGTHGYLVYLSATQALPASNANRANGFSVRCLKK